MAVLLISARQGGASDAPAAVLDVLAGEASIYGPEKLSLESGADSALAAGDTVVTGPSSSAVVVFFDGSVAMLGSSTTMIIEQVDGSRESGETAIQLYQSAGRSFHRVQKLVDADSSYAVRSSTSVGLVRGTVFIVDVDTGTGDAAWKTVEGTVRVAGAVGPEVSLVAGTATTVESGSSAAPPAPVPVTDDERPFLDAIEVVIEESGAEPPPDRDPERNSTPIPGPTPTLPPVGPSSIAPPEVTTADQISATAAVSADRPDRPAPEGQLEPAAPEASANPPEESVDSGPPRSNSSDNGGDGAVPAELLNDNGPANHGDQDIDPPDAVDRDREGDGNNRAGAGEENRDAPGGKDGEDRGDGDGQGKGSRRDPDPEDEGDGDLRGEGGRDRGNDNGGDSGRGESSGGDHDPGNGGDGQGEGRDGEPDASDEENGERGNRDGQPEGSGGDPDHGDKEDRGDGQGEGGGGDRDPGDEDGRDRGNDNGGGSGQRDDRGRDRDPGDEDDRGDRRGEGNEQSEGRERDRERGDEDDRGDGQDDGREDQDDEHR